MPKLKNILIAPLDWGLGHATRNIPLITSLLEKNCSIYIAAEGQTKALLQQEFPQLKFLHLKGYRVQYAQSSRWFTVKMILQVPGILMSIYKEHQWLKKVVRKYSIDVVIADNRFGLWNRSIKSVYITHQLSIKTGNKITEAILQQCHYWFIKKYSICWVPDYDGPKNIAGELSHPSKRLPHVYYTGCLSRMEASYRGQPVFDLMILLSGPEPQRTIFEKDVLIQLAAYEGRTLIVRGLPSEQQSIAFPANNQGITIKNHLAAKELSLAMGQAKMILCRAGYTTIMDLLKLQKKAILVPTPGQTEQEYLAKYLMQRQLFYSEQQCNFSLRDALESSASFDFRMEEYNMQQYQQEIAKLLDGIEAQPK